MKRTELPQGQWAKALADIALNLFMIMTLVVMALIGAVDAEGLHFDGLEKLIEKMTSTINQLQNDGNDKQKVIDLQKQEKVDLKTKLQRISQRMASTNKKIEGLNQSLDNANRENHTLQEAIERGEAVDLVFLQDTSASQESEFKRIATACSQTALLLPHVVDLRIGGVAFSRNASLKLLLEDVFPNQKDNGRSLRRLKKYFTSLSVVEGHVAVDKALEEGIDLLEQAPRRQARQVLVLITDVAPGDVAGVHHIRLALMKQRLTGWINVPGTDRRFFMIFSHRNFTNSSYNPVTHKQAMQSLADLPRGRFEDEASAIFPGLFESMFANQQGK